VLGHRWRDFKLAALVRVARFVMGKKAGGGTQLGEKLALRIYYDYIKV
jgi:hypothetical protein